jgi:hydroxyacylglutathione hydrolase
VDTTIPKEDPKEDSLYAMDVVTIKALLGQKTPLAFVDIRPESAWSQGSLEGAMGMPEDTVGIRVSELPTDRMVVVVCGDGKASARVVRFFRERGMEDTWFLAGGLNAWVQAANSLVPLEVS